MSPINFPAQPGARHPDLHVHPAVGRPVPVQLIQELRLCPCVPGPETEVAHCGH